MPKKEAIHFIDKILKKSNITVALVEADHDKAFWKTALQRYAPAIDWRVMATSEISGSSSVHEVLKYHKLAHRRFVLCIDSDLRYFIEDKYLQNPYIFHTYTYSIENYLCAPKVLHGLFADILNQTGFDFYDFFKKYSTIVFPVFLYNLYFERMKYKQALEGEKVMKTPFIRQSIIKQALCIPVGEKISTENADILEKIRKNVQRFQADLLKKQPKAREISIYDEMNELHQKFDYKTEQTFWYINGHLLLNCVVKRIVSRLFNELKNKFNNRQINWQMRFENNFSTCFEHAGDCLPLQKLQHNISHFAENIMKS